jgi:hypothetical protein
LSTRTWYGSLELAEEYGWTPMGTVLPEWEVQVPVLEVFGMDSQELWVGDYWTDHGSLVLFEDALNIADALDKAFLDYEPVRLPSLHEFFLNFDYRHTNGRRPNIGVIEVLTDFCRSGAFYIEKV